MQVKYEEKESERKNGRKRRRRALLTGDVVGVSAINSPTPALATARRPHSHSACAQVKGR